MEFFSFHLMPWPYLPATYDGPAWIHCPNALFEPEQGHVLYNRYLDELEYAEQLGFDGLVVNEHHQNAYGLMPSPNLFAAMLARRTTRAKLAVVGNALPLYHPPTRVAEEYTILDVVSGGRLIAGMVVGGGPEYYSFGVNPAEARRRFAEALDLIVRAWTEPGPFEFDGEFTPPGYTTARSAMRLAEAQGRFLLSVRTWQEVVEGGHAIVGSPESVTDQLAHHIETLGAGYLMGLFQLGTLPRELTKKNLELFAAEVMPTLRREFPTGPRWAEATAAA